MDSQRAAHLLKVDLVADHNRRYPGETVTLFCRITARQTVAAYTLRISIPVGLAVLAWKAPGSEDEAMPRSEFEAAGTHLTWQVNRRMETGVAVEYQVQAQIALAEEDASPVIRASATPQIDGKRLLPDEESVAVLVPARGAYIRYLPAIYYQDNLMGRLLMLFESFWAPIEQQTKTVPFYFDPRMTPASFLPWLASWLELVLDVRLPEERQRRLIRAAVALYRKRGTRDGLREYLELYTGASVHITEQRANNFRLGADGRLGAGVALGTENRPHMFAVSIMLPRLSVPSGGRKERARLEKERRRSIEAIIEAEKPAHTDYVLRIETE